MSGKSHTGFARARNKVMFGGAHLCFRIDGVVRRGGSGREMKPETIGSAGIGRALSRI